MATNILFNRHGLQDEPYSIVHVAAFNWWPGFEARSHFSQFQIFYIAEGSGHYAVDGHYMPLASGMIFWNSPGCFREIWCNEDEHLDVLLVGATGRRLPKLVGQTLGTLHGTARPRHGNEIQELWRQIIAVGQGRHLNCEKILAHYLPVLLYTLQRHTLEDSTTAPERLQTYLACKRYIERHFMKLHSCEAVADEHGISHEYLCRLFKDFHNGTPHHYLLQIKMSHALDMLETKDRSIKQIAYQLGFSSTSSFSKTFKRVMGKSPSEFRERPKRRA